MRLSQEPIHRGRGFLARRRRNLRVDIHLLHREMNAKAGIAKWRPIAGGDNACIRAELGIPMRLIGPLSHVLDATRARCYKSAHSIPESWRDN
jgi:hypothetical protein